MKFPQKSSNLMNRSSGSGKVTFSRKLRANAVVPKEDYFDFSSSDEDSDFEDGDHGGNLIERTFSERDQRAREIMFHSDESDDSEDEDMMEMEIEKLEEDIKRMEQNWELNVKVMDENEIRKYRQKFVLKRRELVELEEMLETRYMMRDEEMKRSQEMDFLVEDIKRIEEIFETHGKDMTEDEINDLDQKYSMKEKQLRVLEKMQEMRGMMEEGGMDLDVIEDEERMDNMNEMLAVQRSDLEHQPEDLLQKHIGEHDLGLVFRPPTRFKRQASSATN